MDHTVSPPAQMPRNRPPPEGSGAGATGVNAELHVSVTGTEADIAWAPPRLSGDGARLGGGMQPEAGGGHQIFRGHQKPAAIFLRTGFSGPLCTATRLYDNLTDVSYLVLPAKIVP